MSGPLGPTETYQGESGNVPRWTEVWVGTLARPSENTFRDFLDRDPDAGVTKALIWIFGSTFLGWLILAVLYLIFGLFTGGDLFGASDSLGGVLIALVCAVPVAAIVAVVAFLIWSALIHGISRLLGGVGTFDELSYAFAGYVAPLAIISGIVSAIPILNCLSPLIGIYGLVLNVMAVKAVHRFEWGRAIVASLSLVIIAFLLALCLGIVLVGSLAALAPSIDSIFNEILQGLGPVY